VLAAGILIAAVGIGLANDIGLPHACCPARYFSSRPVATDFPIFYAEARVVLRDGWTHLYDVTAQKAVYREIGRTFTFANVHPPTLIWMVLPFTLLPLGLAFGLWTGLLIGLLLGVWMVAAPGTGLRKVAQLGVALASVPVLFSISLGQSVLLVAAGVTACWWLLGRKHQWMAGVALGLILVKPQLALLVPLTLGISGYWRTAFGFVVTTVAASLIALFTVGATGLGDYLAALATASRHPVEFLNLLYLSVPGLLQERFSPSTASVAALGFAVLIAMAASVAAYFSRGKGPEAPLVAGLLGSMIITPFIHMQDLAMLVLAAWLFLRTDPSAWRVWILLLLYLSVNLVVFVDQSPVVAFEVAWLASLLIKTSPEPRDRWWSRRSGTRVRTEHPVPTSP
jgi:hypothetical protein